MESTGYSQEKNRYKQMPKEELSTEELHKLEVTRDTRKRLGAALALARKEAGLTQEDVKDATGISRGQVTRMERGGINMSLDDLSLIADVLGYEIVAIKKI